jgi:hypothetical protein
MDKGKEVASWARGSTAQDVKGQSEGSKTPVRPDRSRAPPANKEDAQSGVAAARRTGVRYADLSGSGGGKCVSDVWVWPLVGTSQ